MNKENLQILMQQMGRRPRLVLEHILEHGQVTTQELKDRYGYNHPPRAARDVREWGVPIDTIRVTGTDGRKIGAYVLPDDLEVSNHKRGGRRTFSKAFKEALYQIQTGHCAVCLEQYEIRYLQVDHRVPYEVGGETIGANDEPEFFMLLCGECNRKKSWSCEGCANWNGDKNITVCQKCYWGNPSSYEHVATMPMRRVELVWTAKEELAVYNDLDREAMRRGVHISDIIKARLGGNRS